MKILKPKQGKVIINHNGKRVELPTKATDELLSLPAVKRFLADGIIELVDEKGKKTKSEKQDNKESSKGKVEQKGRRGRPYKDQE